MPNALHPAPRVCLLTMPNTKATLIRCLPIAVLASQWMSRLNVSVIQQGFPTGIFGGGGGRAQRTCKTIYNPNNPPRVHESKKFSATTFPPRKNMQMLLTTHQAIQQQRLPTTVDTQGRHLQMQMQLTSLPSSSSSAPSEEEW